MGERDMVWEGVLMGRRIMVLEGCERMMRA
jgi:hypothetical protein